MRGTGFEPVQALSYHGLNVTRLTTPASPHRNDNSKIYIRVMVLFFIVGIEQKVKEGFFDSRVTMLINDDCSDRDSSSMTQRLENLGFKYEVIRCKGIGGLELHHRGDVIRGNRVNYFLEYAGWLKAA